MKMLWDIIIEEINNRIKEIKDLINKESQKRWLAMNKDQHVYIASLYDKISEIKRLKKNLIHTMAELEKVMEISDNPLLTTTTTEDPITAATRDFEELNIVEI